MIKILLLLTICSSYYAISHLNTYKAKQSANLVQINNAIYGKCLKAAVSERKRNLNKPTKNEINTYASICYSNEKIK